MNMHLIVDRYMRETLAEDEKAKFEERLLWDEELVDELDLAERLHEGLQASVKHDDVTTSRAGVLDLLSSVLFVPQYAAAASFLVAMVLTASMFMSPLMSSGERGGGMLATTELVPLLVLRGIDAPTVHVSEDAWTVLLVDVFGSYESYRVTVRKDMADTAPFWEQAKLLPTYPDSLAVGMPGTSLAPGRYILSVEGARDTQADETIYEHLQDIRFVTAFAD